MCAHVTAAITCKYVQQDSQKLTGSMCEVESSEYAVVLKTFTGPPVPAQLADIVAARAEDGKNYGIILLPEGLIEHVPEVSTHPHSCVLHGRSLTAMRGACIGRTSCAAKLSAS